MADRPAARLANPRVGVFMGIFISLLAAVGLVALLLEALTAGSRSVALLLVFGPVCLYACFALAVATRDPHDYFAAGRRVPGAIAGSTMALVALGGTGVVSLTGALCMMGSDAFAILLGFPAGLIVAGVLFVPFLRKFGAYTVPSYLGARLDSRPVAVVAALLFAVPAALLVLAELSLARDLVRHLLGLPGPLAAALVGTIALLLTVTAGMRALVWTSLAKLVATLVAILLPATIAAVYLSNVPVPQLTAGSTARLILRTELFRDVPQLFATPWMVDLPAPDLEALGRRFLQMFGSIGASAYGPVTLIVLAGVASTSALLMRPTATPSVGASRNAVAWSVVLTAFLILSLAAVATYTRGMISEHVLGKPADRLPGWFQALMQQGVAAISARGDTPVSLASIAVQRDRIATALPLALGLPWGMTAIMLAGSLAACFAAATAHLHTLASSIAEDLINGRDAEAVEPAARLLTARIALAIVAGLATLATFWPHDPLALMMWSLALSASAAFPVLALSVLWKRLTAFGAIAGVITGFVACVLPSVLPGWPIPLDLPLSAVLAVPLAFIAAVGVSFVTPAVGRPTLHLLRDMRVPGGETLMDRQRRLLRLKRAD